MHFTNQDSAIRQQQKHQKTMIGRGQSCSASTGSRTEKKCARRHIGDECLMSGRELRKQLNIMADMSHRHTMELV